MSGSSAYQEAALEPLLDIERVTKSFGPVLAVDDVSFSVAKGEIHSLVGENGAGKSTVVKIITGLAGFELALDGARETA